MNPHELDNGCRAYPMPDDWDWRRPFTEITASLRRQLPRLAPMRIVTAAKLIHALERLPLVTNGIYVEAEVDDPACRRTSWALVAGDGYVELATRLFLDEGYDAGSTVALLRAACDGREDVVQFDRPGLHNWLSGWSKHIDQQIGICYDPGDQSGLDDWDDEEGALP